MAKSIVGQSFGKRRILVEEISPNQDAVAMKRSAEIRANPSLGRSEKELDAYLKKRGVRVDRLGD